MITINIAITMPICLGLYRVRKLVIDNHLFKHGELM